jgi:hypothetical protein
MDPVLHVESMAGTNQVDHGNLRPDDIRRFRRMVTIYDITGKEPKEVKIRLPIKNLIAQHIGHDSPAKDRVVYHVCHDVYIVHHFGAPGQNQKVGTEDEFNQAKQIMQPFLDRETQPGYAELREFAGEIRQLGYDIVYQSLNLKSGEMTWKSFSGGNKPDRASLAAKTSIQIHHNRYAIETSKIIENVETGLEKATNAAKAKAPQEPESFPELDNAHQEFDEAKLVNGLVDAANAAERLQILEFNETVAGWEFEAKKLSSKKWAVIEDPEILAEINESNLLELVKTHAIDLEHITHIEAIWMLLGKRIDPESKEMTRALQKLSVALKIVEAELRPHYLTGVKNSSRHKIPGMKSRKSAVIHFVGNPQCDSPQDEIRAA